MNLILRNSDAHGKNISFFVMAEDLVVAPFYYIVNVTMYKGLYGRDMAMAIDKEFVFNEIEVFDIKEFLQTNSISTVLYFEEFKKAIEYFNRLGKSDEILKKI